MIINIEKVESYLKTVRIFQNVNLILTDLEKVIYCNPYKEREGSYITEELKEFINNCDNNICMEKNVFNDNEKEIMNIIENEELEDNKYISQMIVPLEIDNEKIGSLIFFRDRFISYPKKHFVKSKLKSIEITKHFLEEYI